jgi:DNA-binding NtrC family response regulator
MSEPWFALLVHPQPDEFEPLRRTLRDLGVETRTVATCRQARDLISECRPQMVFTEPSVRDGSWQTILRMAEAADVPLSVIVTAAVPDTRLYLRVMEAGAFDFVAPPFEHESLDFVVRSAALNAQRRREATAFASAR